MDLDLNVRRLAMQMAMQLPDDRKEAIAVLDLVRELFDGYLSPRCEVVRLRDLSLGPLGLRGLDGGGTGPTQD